MIEAIQKKYAFTIGRRRMTTLLDKLYGVRIGECQAGRLMRQFGLKAKTRQIRKARMCTRKALKEGLPDNILDRNFICNVPRKHFVTDVTYIPYYEDGEWHWSYLSLVLDLYNREIVAWKLSKTQDIRLALDTLMILSFKHPAEGAMLHSDHGSIYTAKVFRDTLAAMGITQSLSRVANCHDNAPMECFNGTLKVEALYNTSFPGSDRTSFLERNEMISRFIDFYKSSRGEHSQCSSPLTPPTVRIRSWRFLHLEQRSLLVKRAEGRPSPSFQSRIR